MSRLLALAALCLVACREPVSAAPDAAVEPRAAVVAGDGGWALTNQVLAAWLGYQAVMLAQAPLGRPDGGAASLRDQVRRRARAELAARADAGLSEDDVDRVEELVAAVAVQRNIARLTGADALRDFERAAGNLKDEQRLQAVRALANLKARVQQAAALDAERARFGDETVRVLLTREADVIKTWDALMDARGDPR